MRCLKCSVEEVCVRNFNASYATIYRWSNHEGDRVKRLKNTNKLKKSDRLVGSVVAFTVEEVVGCINVTRMCMAKDGGDSCISLCKHGISCEMYQTVD